MLAKHFNYFNCRLKHKERLQHGDRVDCVFWDFKQLEWSTDGCHRVEEESNLIETVCKCNHLTNFAALMDVNGREEWSLTKAILSYICGFLSIFGLVFTINLIVRRRPHSSEKNISVKASLDDMRSIITCNLCVCLLLTNLLVLFGMDRTNISVKI